MAIITTTILSPIGTKNPSPLRFTPQEKPPNTTINLKCNLPISRYSLTKRLPSKDQNFIGYNYGVVATNAHHQKTPISASAGEEIPIPESNSRRIWLSDVVVKRENNVFFRRKWHFLDVANLSLIMLMHGLAMFAPFNFNWAAFWVAVLLYVATGLLGICLSYHRNLSHRSFKLPKWLEYFCAYCGVLAFQGDPIFWVSVHRNHHQYCDSEQDPHSPIGGFWFSHINWIFDTRALVRKCGKQSNVGDLKEQPFYKFLRRTYILHPLALGVLLYAIGGFPFIVWGMGIRTILVSHITWLINSVGHIWGNQAWNTGDLSRNNWLLALLLFGEGWHNNHHAFEYSARHGLEWWQVDMTWYVVKLLETIGLAKDVKLPSEAHKQRMKFKVEA